MLIPAQRVRPADGWRRTELPQGGANTGRDLATATGTREPWCGRKPSVHDSDGVGSPPIVPVNGGFCGLGDSMEMEPLSDAAAWRHAGRAGAVPSAPSSVALGI